MNYLVIMPTFNEVSSLETTVGDLFEHNPKVSLLIVDDASPDGTGDLAETLASKDSRIAVLHRPQKEGLGIAYLAGFEYARVHGFDYIIEMDADGSHRGEDLPALILASKSAPLVIGSRYVSGGEALGWPLYRRLISRIGNLYTSVMLGAHISDITAGFRVYKLANLLPKLTGVAAHGYAFQVELAWRFRLAGERVIEVPITFVERAHGNSKMSSAIVREALWLTTKWGLVRLFRRRP
jgi:dolichol-phosphate mannosyltransferase